MYHLNCAKFSFIFLYLAFVVNPLQSLFIFKVIIIGIAIFQIWRGAFCVHTYVYVYIHEYIYIQHIIYIYVYIAFFLWMSTVDSIFSIVIFHICMSLFESTLLNFCKPQSKLGHATLRHGSRERKNATEQIKNDWEDITLSRLCYYLSESTRGTSTKTMLCSQYI